ncbi:MAG: DUF3341 domain-containing protein [Terriglobia bacterium]
MRFWWRRWSGGVLGTFAHLDTTVAAVRRLQKASFTGLRVVSPVPRHEILEAVNPGPSPVRFYALIGGISGTLAGLGLAVVTSQWMEAMAYRTGGKPVISWPPFFIIGFELTVLFGTLATLTGFMIHAWLPRRQIRVTYDPRFSDDLFGVFVPCEPGQREEVKLLLAEAGAEEVRLEEG